MTSDNLPLRVKEMLLSMVSQGFVLPLLIGDRYYITLTDYLNAESLVNGTR